ncbi:DUF4192 domain-containing protein [Gordonia phosphorivorans]|uniref:DUF4192 domain-containing protein n=1 Tax=Gordonia phosphorivorans TaxID=1056982 RepID=A0ABV6H8S4_9ACTN
MTSLPHFLPDEPALRVDPDPLLAAVPGLLGFRPERSLVLLAFRDERRLLVTLRLDVLLAPSGEPAAPMRESLDSLGAIVAGYGAVGVVAVVVDAGAADYARVFGAVERSFAAAGGLSAGFVIDEMAAGARWCLAWEPRCRVGRVLPPPPFAGPIVAEGRLSDPLLSPIALQRTVFGGRDVLAHRDDLAAALTPRAHCDSAVCRPVTPEVPPGRPGERDAVGARLVLAHIERGADGPLDCTEVNALAEALCSVHTRDMLLALAVTDAREAAEALWTRLTRSLTGRAGAAAATLLAHLHYLAGEGAFAGVAVERALELDAQYHLARLLQTALTHGLRPADLGEVLSHSFGLGARLGVPLPVQTRNPVG